MISENSNTKVEPFRKETELMTNEKRSTGTRISRELPKRSYPGSRSAHYLYLKKMKIDLDNNKITSWKKVSRTSVGCQKSSSG